MNLKYCNERFAYFQVGIPIQLWKRIQSSTVPEGACCAWLRHQLADSALILAERPEIARAFARSHDA